MQTEGFPCVPAVSITSQTRQLLLPSHLSHLSSACIFPSQLQGAIPWLLSPTQLHSYEVIPNVSQKHMMPETGAKAETVRKGETVTKGGALLPASAGTEPLAIYWGSKDTHAAFSGPLVPQLAVFFS